MSWIFNLLEWEWHFSISDSLLSQVWDPLRVRFDWVEVPENLPSKALFILVLDIRDCLLLRNLTREFYVRQSIQWFVPVEMNFEWSYSLKPPVASFPVISLNSFQDRVHRRLPLRQSLEVSGHLSMEVGIYELGWSVFIVSHRHPREYHLDLRLTVVSHDLKTSGLTSSVNSLGLYLDCLRSEVALQTLSTRKLTRGLQIEEVVCTSLRSPSTCLSLLIL